MGDQTGKAVEPLGEDARCQAKELGNGEPPKALEEESNAIGSMKEKMGRELLSDNSKPLPEVHSLHSCGLPEFHRKTDSVTILGGF